MQARGGIVVPFAAHAGEERDWKGYRGPYLRQSVVCSGLRDCRDGLGLDEGQGDSEHLCLTNTAAYHGFRDW